MGRAALALFLGLAPPAFGLAALTIGMDANWDLRNYHYYNAYAFLAGREGRDFLVAQLPTFFNPLIDVPFFLASQAWPARLIGFLLGTVQGLNILPLYGIAYATLTIEPRARRRLVAAGLALLGMIGAGALSELGTTFYDNVVSLGPLTALWLILRDHGRLLRGSPREAGSAPILAGLISGLAVGLKQPIVTLPIGLCLALPFVPAAPRRRVLLPLLFGLGVLLGMAASSGFWLLHLWRAYDNPLFPFYNQLFRSPWGLAQNYRDVFPMPSSLWARLFLPFAALFDPRLVADTDFRDLRIPACFLLIPLAAAVALLRRVTAAPALDSFSDPARTRYLFTSFAIGYGAWVLLFCVYRYIIAYEMLAPLVIVVAIGLLPVGRPMRLGAAVGLLALTLVTQQIPDWIRVPWGDRWVTATPPVLPDPDHTVVLITGHEPLSYLVPFFPPAVRFLRIHGGFTKPDETSVRFNIEMRRIVSTHQGPLYVLFNPNEMRFATKHLAAYGLAIDAGACQTVPSNIGYLPYSFCSLRRQG